MSLSMLIYLAEVLGSLKTAIGVLLLIVSVGVVIGAWFGPIIISECRIEGKVAWSFAKKAMGAIALTVLVYVSIPTTQTIYLMAGAKVVEQVVASPEVKQINAKILTIINNKLDSLADEKKAEK